MAKRRHPAELRHRVRERPDPRARFGSSLALLEPSLGASTENQTYQAYVPLACPSLLDQAAEENLYILQINHSLDKLARYKKWAICTARIALLNRRQSSRRQMGTCLNHHQLVAGQPKGYMLIPNILVEFAGPLIM